MNQQNTCPHCHRKFIGENCMGNHYAYSKSNGVKASYDKKIKKVCSTVRKCPKCNCPLWDYEIDTERMFAEPANALLSSSPKISPPINVTSKISANSKRKGNCRDLKRGGSMAAKSASKKTPFLSTGTVRPCKTRVHMPNLMCAAMSDTNMLYHFEGTNCIANLLDWL